MAIVVAQSISVAAGTGGTWPASFSSTPTVGNAVIVGIAGMDDGGLTGVADNQTGNTYTKIIAQLDAINSSTQSSSASLYWCPAISGASGTFTVTATPVTPGQGGWGAVALLECSGIGSVDQTGSANDGGTSPTSLTVTAGGANTNATDLVVGIIALKAQGLNATFLSAAPTTGYGSGLIVYNPNSQGPQCCGGFKILAGVETSSMVSQTWTTGQRCAGAIATFAPPLAAIPLLGQVLT